jgi:hypothetical protein
LHAPGPLTPWRLGGPQGDQLREVDRYRQSAGISPVFRYPGHPVAPPSFRTQWEIPVRSTFRLPTLGFAVVFLRSPIRMAEKGVIPSEAEGSGRYGKPFRA